MEATALLNHMELLDRISGSNYSLRMFETMRGEGDFWCSGPDWYTQAPKYDAEQYLAVFMAVQKACQCQGSAADRWKIVERELVKLAHEYASGQ
jgi:hypothetical protein